MNPLIRKLSFLFVALACWTPSAPARAQTADALKTDLQKDWTAQKARLVALAEAMPAEKYDYKTTPEQRTFGEQLHHLAQAHVSMFKTLDPDAKVTPPTIGPAHGRDDIVKALTAAYAFGDAVIAQADLLVPVKAGGPIRARTVWSAMGNAMNHYGQLVVYLRANGIVPPASRK